YYPDWDGSLIPPKEVDMGKFDLINFAFAVPTSSYGVQFTQDNSGTLLKQLVSYAHGKGNNTKVVIAVGGWTDSVYFSSAVSTSTNRAKFVKNIVTMANTYGVDGIDIDWCYPGGGGDSGNQVSSKDTANFLLFLQALRTSLGSDKIISACTTQQAFLGADGSPLTDVSAFAAVLDHILVMNYDVWGASSNPGPNAPLTNACSGSLQPNANMASAITAWTKAGMPASKILMGVPSYGYISSSTATKLIHPCLHTQCPNLQVSHASSLGTRPTSSSETQGGRTCCKARRTSTRRRCPHQTWNDHRDGNQIQFYQLLSYGVMVQVGTTTTYKGANGYTRAWDTCSSTPYLYDVSRKTVITYDDPQSMTLKGQLAASSKLAGLGMWDISGDTPQWDLVNAFRTGMGL
ncbi:glycoside hydrolase family 18 protein, partial [Meredithblackwellia eburnea MCA 4105]